jgi:hypothetical protein
MGTLRLSPRLQSDEIALNGSDVGELKGRRGEGEKGRRKFPVDVDSYHYVQ